MPLFVAVSHSIAPAPALTDSVLFGGWQHLLVLEKEKVRESTKTVQMQALQEVNGRLEIFCVDSVSVLGVAIVYRE